MSNKTVAIVTSAIQFEINIQMVGQGIIFITLGLSFTLMK